MRDALRTVLDRAENDEVKWVDVRDDLTSGQWGRLIETGVLVDGESGFRIEDPDEARAALESDDVEDAADEDDDSTWTTWDKAAGVLSLGLFAGYWLEPVRNTLGSSIDLVLGPLNQTLPFYAVVIVIATITGLVSTLLRALLMDMDSMGAQQAKMKELREKQKQAREEGNDAELQKLQQEQMEMMGEQMGAMTAQFRPMVWIMFFTIPAFLWMYWKIGFRGGEAHGAVSGNVVLPIVGDLVAQAPANAAHPVAAAWSQGFGMIPFPAWIAWYFVCSMVFTQLIQKMLNIEMTPSAS